MKVVEHKTLFNFRPVAPRDQFLNDAARQMYPSPAMFDIDRDGQLELVVGDIFGSLNVYENLSDEKSDPVWSTHIPLKLSDGEKVKVSNW